MDMSDAVRNDIYFSDNELEMDDSIQYNNFKREFTTISDYINEYEFFIQTLNKMRTYKFSIDQLINQVNSYIEVNKNLQDQLKQNIQIYEKDVREFTICILVNNKKQIFISRRNNSTKDFYSKYQVSGGGKKNNESYEQYAKRETKEETNVDIYELDLVTVHQGFRVEASNNDEWFSVELKNFGKYDLTDSLKGFKSVIVEKINNHSVVHSEDEIEISNRPSEEEILDNISKLKKQPTVVIESKEDISVFFERYFTSLTVELINSGIGLIWSNHTLGHDFENKLAKLLNENGLIANIISCNP
ncbi:11197_t:CDS:2, partial [Gigaspora rosea]